MKTYTYTSQLGHAVFCYDTEDKLNAKLKEVKALLMFIDIVMGCEDAGQKLKEMAK